MIIHHSYRMPYCRPGSPYSVRIKEIPTFWKYLVEFDSIENIPLHEIELYELANDLIQPEEYKKSRNQDLKL